MAERDSTTTMRDRARGMLVGLAVGDALGAPVEFGFSSEEIRKLGDRIREFRDHRIPAGVWTDDTEMALCLADSLIERGGYDSYDIMDRYVRWVNDGYRTYDNRPACDVGFQTNKAIAYYRRDPVIHKGQEKTSSAGNGPIMRLAPVIIANTFTDKKYTNSLISQGLKEVGEMAVLSCRETHNSIAAEVTTALFAATLFAALCGLDKTTVWSYAERGSVDGNDEYDRFWIENVDLLVNRWRKKDAEEGLRDLGGYVVDAFAIAMWGFVNSDNFEDGMLKVIRLGGDTDTNAAIYGQLAGAYYGYEAILEEWRRNVYLADELVGIADKLLDMPECPIIRTRFEDDAHFRGAETPKSLSELIEEYKKKRGLE